MKDGQGKVYKDHGIGGLYISSVSLSLVSHITINSF